MNDQCMYRKWMNDQCMYRATFISELWMLLCNWQGPKSDKVNPSFCPSAPLKTTIFLCPTTLLLFSLSFLFQGSFSNFAFTFVSSSSLSIYFSYSGYSFYPQASVLILLLEPLNNVCSWLFIVVQCEVVFSFLARKTEHWDKTLCWHISCCTEWTNKFKGVLRESRLVDFWLHHAATQSEFCSTF